MLWKEKWWKNFREPGVTWYISIQRRHGTKFKKLHNQNSCTATAKSVFYTMKNKSQIISERISERIILKDNAHIYISNRNTYGFSYKRSGKWTGYEHLQTSSYLGSFTKSPILQILSHRSPRFPWYLWRDLGTLLSALLYVSEIEYIFQIGMFFWKLSQKFTLVDSHSSTLGV